jgi:glutathione synthase
VRRGLYFVGIDVIGDYLTEVNVTCPTCIRELDTQFGLDIGAKLINCIDAKLNGRGAALGAEKRPKEI